MSKDLIYHYCSVETLFSMIKYKQLWLSDSSYMNDKEEIIWVDKIVLKLLKKKIENSETEDKKNFEKLKKEYEQLPHKKHFLMCFSKYKDSLSQWRAYGDDAKGIAIGFDRSLLPLREEMIGQIDNEEPFSTTNQLGVEDISYSIECQFNKLLENINSSQISLTAQILKESAVACKHPSFAEEKEVRLIYTPENIQHEDNDVSTLSNKLFRTQNGNIVPYYEYDFKDLEDFLSEIIFGSKCALNKEDLIEYLKSECINKIDIHYSSSSYR